MRRQSSEARLRLIRQVLETAYRYTDNWTDFDLGMQLAYLSMAISYPSQYSPMELDVEIGSMRTILHLFRAWFNPRHKVWNYIRILHEVK
jgi:hypothetical protein